MRFLILLLVLGTFQLSAQNDLQFVKVKNDDRSVNLSVINHSDKIYNLTISVELTGLESDEKFPMTINLEANSKAAIGKLKPTSEKSTHYLINYKVNQIDNPVLVYEPNVTIYTKNKNKRSTQLLIYLNQNGIAYNEINTSYNGDTEQMYLDMLKRRGIERKQARIPVIIYRGEVYNNIDNVKNFCKTHFANEGRFIKKKDRKY